MTRISVDIKNLKEPNSVAYTNTGFPPITPLIEKFEWFDDIANPNMKSIHLEFEEHKHWSLFRSSQLFNTISYYVRTYFSNSENISIEITQEYS